jgi:hypothetical protein
VAVVYSDRRARAGDQLAARFLRAEGPVAFDELADGRDVAAVSAWLGHGVSEGMLEEREGGRFTLRDRGARILRSGRRQTDAS